MNDDPTDLLDFTAKSALIPFIISIVCSRVKDFSLMNDVVIQLYQDTKA